MKPDDSDDRIKIDAVETILSTYLTVKRYHLRHRGFDGGWIGPMSREIVHRPRAVAVLPYDPKADKILLIEQFRLPAHLAGLPAWQREAIAGLDDKNEDDLSGVARREAQEEAGCDLGELIEICRMLPSAGVLTEAITIYCGQFDSRTWKGGSHGLPEEHEDIRASLVDADEIPSILADPATSNATLIIALQWLLLNRARLRKSGF